MAISFEVQALIDEFKLPITCTEPLNEVAASATSVAWDMLTLVPPSILCTPEKFSDDWHKVVGKPCVKGRHYKLSYYRPLMLYHAHGPVAVKAIVGKESTSDTLNTESDSDGW